MAPGEGGDFSLKQPTDMAELSESVKKSFKNRAKNAASV